MPDLGTVVNLGDALRVKTFPAITRWNRLEGRPRSHHFDRALRAEVRDALWMLTRQWQMGEFKADDAGSPMLARMCVSRTRLDRFQAGAGPIEPFSLEVPLEATVERRFINWSASGQPLSMDLRAAIGRHWIKLLRHERAAGNLSDDYTKAYITAYPFEQPDPDAAADSTICAHAEAWQQAIAFAGRAMDGYRFLQHIADPSHHAFDGVGAAAGDEAPLTALAETLRAWTSGLVLEPAGDNAWLPRKLEYQFGCSAPLEQNDFVARAQEYYQGHLDWYAFERSADNGLGEGPSGGPPPAGFVSTFLPVPIEFPGMPNTRWWKFEEGRTNLAGVSPDTTDLGKLLLLEFGLVYSNDWFVVPYTLPIGTLTRVRGIAVTNVFDERIWVEPVQDRPAAEWQRWSMFQLTAPSAAPASAEPALLLVPAATHVQQSPPLEEVALVRDEMANMVWGIERSVPLASGRSKPGSEAARELFNHLERIIGPPPAPPAPSASLAYRVMNSVPEHWIPFVPVHIEGSAREIQLQRAALLRLLGPDVANFEKVRPRTRLLREGLEQSPAQRYFIDEEEVPRAGALVRQTFQRTRWLGGTVFVWIGATKTTGRGEVFSGLAFDRLVAT
jgi:hypothetical protein